MPQNTATFAIEDYDYPVNKKRSSSSVNIGPLTAANFTAKRAAVNTLEAAIQGLILGELRKTTISENFAISSNPVSDPNAQRGVKWLVTYRDDTQFLDVGNTINNVGFGNLYDLEIPCADPNLLANNDDTLDLAGTEAAAFVTAFEAIQNSPTGGNTCTVVSIRLVQRTL